MTIKEYEDFVLAAAHFEAGIADLMKDPERTEAFLRLSYVSGKLNGEAGEFVEEVQKSLRDSGGDITDRRDDMILELGDVIWYVTAACHELGVSLEELMEANRAKLEARWKKQDKQQKKRK
jgi:NTP pyrophosphatase (non-canonical NTP hydrolase)